MAGSGVRPLHVSEYYAEAPQIAYAQGRGETAESFGQHAGILDTAELLAVRPEGVHLSRLGDTRFRLEASGGSGDPSRATAELGRALIDIKVNAAVRQIRAAARSGEGH
jgi:creatinine amidohydrolase/Fe(II)-dependent formamide hydrolase-like protein